MSENSFIGAIGLVTRPFFEEYDGQWRLVKGVCIASLVVAIMLWVFATIANPVYFSRAKLILNVTGWFAIAIFLVSYVGLYWELIMMDKDNVEAKNRKVTGYTDVDKR